MPLDPYHQDRYDLLRTLADRGANSTPPFPGHVSHAEAYSLILKKLDELEARIVGREAKRLLKLVKRKGCGRKV